jgi:hypothetical protein
VMSARSFKPAAVVSSVLLLGGWVSYRAGAWDLHGGPRPKPVPTAPNATVPTAASPLPAAEPSHGQPRREITVFSGSKSLFVPAIPVEATAREPSPAAAPAPVAPGTDAGQGDAP